MKQLTWKDVKPPQYMPGQLVDLAEGDIKAVIARIHLWADGGWRYTVAWWTDGARYEGTLGAEEIGERK